MEFKGDNDTYRGPPPIPSLPTMHSLWSGSGGAPPGLIKKWSIAESQHALFYTIVHAAEIC